MIQKNYEDIIFESRNKSYGAYELRVNYQARLTRAFFYGLSGMAIISISIYFLNHSSAILPSTAQMTDKVDLSQTFSFQQHDIRQNQQVMKSSPNKIQNSVKKPMVDPNSFKLVNNLSPEPIKAISPTTAASIIVTSLQGENGESGKIKQTFGSPNESIVPTVSNAIVDKQPQFPGGLEKFYQFLANNIHFPKQALSAGISAKLYVSFVINKDGKLTQIEFKKKVGYGMEDAVMLVLANSPDWAPGEIKNSKVNTVMILPVEFNLLK